jgi:hypothetical protein
VGAFVVLLLAIAIALPDEEGAPSIDTTATTAEVAETTETPTTTATPATTAPREPFPIGPGVYAVGAEVPPGVYRVGCYWARLDATQEIIDNDLVDDGLLLVNVQPTDAFIEFSCRAAALADMPNLDPIAQGWTGGTYLVGADIAPGQYRVNPVAPLGSYWARLDEQGEIIDNGLSDGQTIVVVHEGDWALSYTGTLEVMG